MSAYPFKLSHNVTLTTIPENPSPYYVPQSGSIVQDYGVCVLNEAVSETLELPGTTLTDWQASKSLDASTPANSGYAYYK